MAHFTRAVGHPARIAVLLEIAKRGYKIQGEIIEVPQLSKATVLQHLRELKRAGFIQGRIFGARAEYQLDTRLLEEFGTIFTEFMKEMNNQDQA